MSWADRELDPSTGWLWNGLIQSPKNNIDRGITLQNLLRVPRYFDDCLIKEDYSRGVASTNFFSTVYYLFILHNT